MTTAFRNNFLRISFSLIPFIIIGFACQTATAYDQPEQNEQAVAKTGVEFQPRLGEYHYQITWAGSPIGKGVIVIEREGDKYILRTEQKTTGLAGKIYELSYRGETRIRAEDLSPVDSIIVEENKKRKKTQVTQYPSSAIDNTVKVTETRLQKKEQEIETEEYEYDTEGGILDLFSAIFLARSFDWQVGERQEFIIFLGPKQYKVTMDCIDQTTLKVGDEDIPVWVIQPSSTNLSEEEEKPKHENTFVYLSADESKDIVKIKTRLGIGTVKLSFVKYLEKND